MRDGKHKDGKHPQKKEPIVFVEAIKNESGGRICRVNSGGKIQYGLVPCQKAILKEC
ncbi:MAG: hypothetical protein PHV68_10330 [Candidatus Gastranaerophilales bacterium]|jgi:hypothetical protein|nr:hypothetical protein [Candidatus Gastranaerophilales bacterium]